MDNVDNKDKQVAPQNVPCKTKNSLNKFTKDELVAIILRKDAKEVELRDKIAELSSHEAKHYETLADDRVKYSDVYAKMMKMQAAFDATKLEYTLLKEQWNKYGLAMKILLVTMLVTIALSTFL